MTRRVPLAGATLTAVLLLGCSGSVTDPSLNGSDGSGVGSTEQQDPAEPGSASADSAPLATDAPVGHDHPGVPDCTLDDLPATALEVIDDIEAGGPFAYPAHDGVTFFNREGLLPQEGSGYYREHTVVTPGLDHRGARRIVTGGSEPLDPEHWFFTADHYESFCEFSG